MVFAFIRQFPSTRLSRITDLLHQADHWARQDGKALIDSDAVTRAIAMRERRADRIRERTLEQILRGTVLIDTDGMRVGQVNGLAVLDVADHAFGSPVRITATARIGEGEVVDIEREVELGGSLHSKGVFILSAFLAARYKLKILFRSILEQRKVLASSELVHIGKNVSIDPSAVIHGPTTIGNNATGSHSILYGRSIFEMGSLGRAAVEEIEQLIEEIKSL